MGTEIRIRCQKEFSLQVLKKNKKEDSGIKISKNANGIAIKYPLDNGKFHYTVEMSGLMFDMSHESFEEFMIEKPLKG